jgi:hypothetical protein
MMRLKLLALLLASILPPLLFTTGGTAGEGETLQDPENRSAAPQGTVLGLDGKPDDLPDAPFGETVRKHCSKCHVPPIPDYLPKGMWRRRIQEMAQRSLTGTGLAPGEESVLWQMDTAKFVRYFESRAPEILPLPEPWPAGAEERLRFSRKPYNPPGAVPVPVVANVRFWDLDGDGRLEIVVCDMGHGVVLLADPNEGSGELREIAKIPNPDHAEMVDLDQDGLQDLLVADLGDFMPGDHKKGSVVWLRQTAPGAFESRPLVQGIARTADARAADFDGDGDLDLVVAAFGWHTVGGIFLYENQTTDWAEPRFEGFPVDARPGGIHVPPVDLNGDGRMDFVALISQQFEHVVAFIARSRGGGFRPETIFRAPVPVWGSSGIQMVDMDGDGDLDLLMSNGDSLDDFTIRPFHGVRWFENTGEYPWTQHDLVIMPGVHRAQAADMDGDGDLDVVACAFLPNADHPAFTHLERQGDIAPFTSVGWLEQVSPGVFEPHSLETGKLTHTTLDLGDYDGDGDVDLALGNFVGFTFAKSDTGFESDAWIEVWENQGSASALTAGSP